MWQGHAIIGDSPRTVEYLVKRFEERGFGGLMDGEHPCRRPQLNQDHVSVIADLPRKSPNDFGFSVQLDGKTLSLVYSAELGSFPLRTAMPAPISRSGAPAS